MKTWTSEKYRGRWCDIEYFNLLDNQNSNMFTLSKENIMSAVVYVVLTAFLGLLAYVVGIGDVYKIDFHSVVNIFSIAIATGLVSIIKNFLTDNSGAFLGVAKTVTPTN